MRKTMSGAGRKRGRSVAMPPTLGYRSNGKLRVLLRPWVADLLDSGTCQGLKWEDKSRKIFSIVWLHASRNGFDASEHSDLFYRWAHHTGRLKKSGKINHSGNKSTFRCALNSLKDCIQLTKPGDKRGESAKRTYQFIEKDHPLYDIKRKARLQTKNKLKLKEETINYQISTPEQSSDMWTDEHDTGSWDFSQTEVVSPTIEEQSSSLPAVEYTIEEQSPSLPAVEYTIEETMATSFDINDFHEANFVIIDAPSPSTASTAMTSMNGGLSASFLSDDDIGNQSVPNLEDLLTPFPRKNRKIVAETQLNGVIALKLQNLGSSENILENPATQGNPLPVFSELGVPEYVTPFCHAKFGSGGSVTVQNTKQVALSHEEFVIDTSLLNQQQEQPIQTTFTFSELDNGNFLNNDSDAYISLDVNTAGELTGEGWANGIDAGSFHQDKTENLIAVPLVDLDEETSIEYIDRFINGVQIGHENFLSLD